MTVSGRPRGQHPTNEELVQAALRCFLRSGYDATTVKQVAEEAGTSVAQLYLTFPSKHALIVAVHQFGTRRLIDDFLTPAMDTEGQSWDRIMAITEAYMRFYIEERELSELLASTSLAELDADDPATQEMYREQAEQAAALYAMYSDLTEGSGVDPAHVFRWCWAAMYGLAAQQMRFPHLALDDDELERIVNVGMRLVRSGLRDLKPPA